MAANRKRTPFNAAGPFTAKKNFSIFETQMEVGKTYPASDFARLHERRVEVLFDSGYIDMAEADAKVSKAKTAAEPTDRDGDGKKGGSLTKPEKDALKQAGLTVDDWLKLPEPERTNALASALQAAPASPPPGAAAGDAGGNSGGGDGEGKKVVAYKHFGFGRWFAVDADGHQIGEKVTKSEAEGLAAHLGVPLKGML